MPTLPIIEAPLSNKNKLCLVKVLDASYAGHEYAIDHYSVYFAEYHGKNEYMVNKSQHFYNKDDAKDCFFQRLESKNPFREFHRDDDDPNYGSLDSVYADFLSERNKAKKKCVETQEAIEIAKMIERHAIGMGLMEPAANMSPDGSPVFYIYAEKENGKEDLYFRVTVEQTTHPD